MQSLQHLDSTLAVSAVGPVWIQPITDSASSSIGCAITGTRNLELHGSVTRCMDEGMMPVMTVPVEHEMNRAQQQLGRVSGQLQKLLRQREDSLARRKAWTELPPEASPDEHLDRLQVLRSERERQPGMQKLADKLSELGDRLLKRLTPSDAQLEMQQSFRSQLQEVGQRERFQQQREELLEQTLREVLTEAAQAHPTTVLQQRMLQAAAKVQQLADQMQPPRSVSAPAPAAPVQTAARNITDQETARAASLRYEQARIEARQDNTAQHEVVTMARELGYNPTRLKAVP
ncbi:hypothetical protein [Streptomyces sp. NPDC088847]|uniref:hypothetical protein n=1 Tax=Streptomyces sp. NPDC088847 TaxID=3365909 RepID=UPI0037F2CE7E